MPIEPSKQGPRGAALCLRCANQVRSRTTADALLGGPAGLREKRQGHKHPETLNVARCGGANEDGGERELSPGNRVEATSLTRSKGLYISIVLGVLLLFGCFSFLLLSFVFVEFVVLFLYFLIGV